MDEKQQRKINDSSTNEQRPNIHPLFIQGLIVSYCQNGDQILQLGYKLFQLFVWNMLASFAISKTLKNKSRKVKISNYF